VNFDPKRSVGRESAVMPGSALAGLFLALTWCGTGGENYRPERTLLLVLRNRI
jgi:hypothetical protein